MDVNMKDPQQRYEPSAAELLVEAHRQLVKSVANEEDSYSLAQPSPLRYVPSITLDRTGGPEGTLR